GHLVAVHLDDRILHCDLRHCGRALPLRARTCGGGERNALGQAPYGAPRRVLQEQNTTRTELRAETVRAIVRAEPGCLGLPKIPTWREIRGVCGRRRRGLPQAMLAPLLVGWPVLRDVVINALSARGHLVLCELGDVRFFVDPSDRVVGAWLMWHGGGRLTPDAVFVDIGAHIGTHMIYALRTGRFARVIAFEPEPRNAALLAKNLEANGLSHAAMIVPKAAA